MPPLEFNPRRTALIVVKNAGNGAETLQAIVNVSSSFVGNDEPLACHGMEGYEPFFGAGTGASTQATGTGQDGLRESGNVQAF
jgi:hypothetical protein